MKTIKNKDSLTCLCTFLSKKLRTRYKVRRSFSRAAFYRLSRRRREAIRLTEEEILATDKAYQAIEALTAGKCEVDKKGKCRTNLHEPYHYHSSLGIYYAKRCSCCGHYKLLVLRHAPIKGIAQLDMQELNLNVAEPHNLRALDPPDLRFYRAEDLQEDNLSISGFSDRT